MTICFHPYVYNEPKEMWEFPSDTKGREEEFEVDMSSANGAEMLCAIGLGPTAHSERPVAINVFAGLLTAALRRHLNQRSPELASVTDNQPARMTIIHCGRSEGYIERRLGDLARLVQRSRAIGATHIGWG